ncbi:hypothetical protein D3C78_1461880 [compost metagenome]
MAQGVFAFLHLQVDHQPRFGEVLAVHADAELFPYGAATAIGSDQVAGLQGDRRSVAVGLDTRVAGIREAVAAGGLMGHRDVLPVLLEID